MDKRGNNGHNDDQELASRPATTAATTLLLSRLRETEALFLKEKDIKEAVLAELARLRSAAAREGQQDGGGVLSSDGKDVSLSRGRGGEGLVREGGGGKGRRHERHERKRPPWQNGLYKRQPYADNYVPDSFLEKLVTNGTYPHTFTYGIAYEYFIGLSVQVGK